MLDVNVHLPRGHDAAAKLQRKYRSWDSASNKCVYVLLDAGIPSLTSDACDLRTFASALFYVGKGVEKRPFEHLEQARDFLLKEQSARVGASDKSSFSQKCAS